jgi:hypothetical protein
MELHLFLISELEGDEWLTYISGSFGSGKGPRYKLIRRVGGPPETVWTFWEKSKIFFFCRDSNLGWSSL